MTQKTSFTDEKEVLANEYIDQGYLEDGQVIPSVVGMAIHLGVAESTLYKWSDDGHGTFSGTLARCKTKQHLTLINKGLKGEFNAAITKLALANHGYSEKTTTELTGANGGPVKTDTTFNFIPVSSND